MPFCPAIRASLAFPDDVSTPADHFVAKYPDQPSEVGCRVRFAEAWSPLQRRFVEFLATIAGNKPERHPELLKGCGEGCHEAILQLHVEKSHVRAATAHQGYSIVRCRHWPQHLATKRFDLVGNIKSGDEVILGDQHTQAAEIDLLQHFHQHTLIQMPLGGTGATRRNSQCSGNRSRAERQG